MSTPPDTTDTQTLADALDQVDIFLSWVPPGHAKAARDAASKVRDAVAALQHERDEQQAWIDRVSVASTDAATAAETAEARVRALEAELAEARARAVALETQKICDALNIRDTELEDARERARVLEARQMEATMLLHKAKFKLAQASGFAKATGLEGGKTLATENRWLMDDIAAFLRVLDADTPETAAPETPATPTLSGGFLEGNDGESGAAVPLVDADTPEHQWAALCPACKGYPDQDHTCGGDADTPEEDAADDLAIEEQVNQRDAEDTGKRLTFDELREQVTDSPKEAGA